MGGLRLFQSEIVRIVTFAAGFLDVGAAVCDELHAAVNTRSNATLQRPNPMLAISNPFCLIGEFLESTDVYRSIRR
jgi:hypothetical protein